MSFRLVFVRRADEEYDHAIDRYLAEAPHEVERFIATFEATVEAIRERPLLPRVVYRELRNVKTAVFPYHLWYRVFEDIELVEGRRRPARGAGLGAPRTTLNLAWFSDPRVASGVSYRSVIASREASSRGV